MATGLQLYSLYLLWLVNYFPDQYNTIHCNSINKNNICNKWYHTHHNLLKNLNQFIDKFPKTFYSVCFHALICNESNVK